MIDEIEQRRLADPAFADNRDGLRPRRPYARKDLGDLAGAPEKLRGVPDCYSIQVWIAWHFGCESPELDANPLVGFALFADPSSILERPYLFHHLPDRMRPTDPQSK